METPGFKEDYCSQVQAFPNASEFGWQLLIKKTGESHKKCTRINKMKNQNKI